MENNGSNDGFTEYIPTTTDPGYSLLVAATIFCALSNLILPCLVSLGRVFEESRAAVGTNQDDEAAGENNQANSKAHSAISSENPGEETRRISIERVQRSRDVVPLPESGTDEPQSPTDRQYTPIEDWQLRRPSSLEIRALSKSYSQRSIGSSVGSSKRGHRTKIRHGGRVRLDRLDLSAQQRLQLGSDQSSPNSTEDSDPKVMNRSTYIRQANEVYSRASSRTFRNKSAKVGGVSSPAPSVLGQLEEHVVSPNDAFGEDDSDHFISSENKTQPCWCWCCSVIGTPIIQLADLVQWDDAMDRIVKLFLAFASPSLLSALCDMAIVIIISHYLGAQSVAAFVVVNLLLGLTSEFLGGILATETALCSQAIGTKNYVLAGCYVQINVLVYTFFMIPNATLWLLLLGDTMRWFGFDEDVVVLGTQYAEVLLLHEWLVGMNVAILGLVSVIDEGRWNTFISTVEDVVSVIVVFVVVFVRETTLREVGLLHLGVGASFFIISCVYAVYNGWLGPFLHGMVGSLAVLYPSALMDVIGSAIPLCSGYFLRHGEWGILSLFAAALGPAEVAAWGILRYVWDIFETIPGGLGDAGEVCCTYYLEASNPKMAQRAAHMSMLLGLFSSCLVTALFFIMGEDLATWITRDPILQHVIVRLFPLIGIANVTLTARSVVWSLVDSQGRYRLAAFTVLFCSWGIILPLAAIFTYVFNFDLQGLVAAIAVGHSLTETVLMYILLRSDWECLSLDTLERTSPKEDGPASQKGALWG